MLHCEPLPAFRDNYIWLLHREGDDQAWVVDPGAAEPVERALHQRGLSLAGILVTHHHADHVGGIPGLLRDRELPVIGPAESPAEDINRPLRDGDRVDVLGISFAVHAIPGHTLDHIAYYGVDDGRSLLFCGDTLFAGGCGRVFEGTFDMMHTSLSRLAALPANTEVYCAHEYTLANLAFAAAVETDNPALQRRIEAATACRKRGEATVPSTLAVEHATNPFLRCDEQSVRAAAARHAGRQTAAGGDTFAVIRDWKDHF